MAESEHPYKLVDSIFARIIETKRKNARRRSIFYVSVACLSLIAFIPATRFAISEFYRTGFYDYLSLAVTDSSTILLSWKEFLLSLADSLPVIAITFALSVIFTFAGSLFMAVRNMKSETILASA